MKTTKRKRSIVALRSLITVAVILAITGCNNSAGIDNGAITGELKMVGGGPLPAVTIRAEGLPASGNVSRYTSIQGMDGSYTITDCKVGVYNITYYIPEYSQGYLYKISLIEGNPSGTDGGGGGEDNAYPASAKASPKKVTLKQGATTIPAYVESGKTYVMPVIYLEKEAASGTGVITGHVYNSRGQNIIVPGATVSLGEASLTDVTDSTGEFIIAGATAGNNYTMTVSAPGYTSPDGITVNVGIGQTLTQDIFMTPMNATIRGNIEVEGKFSNYIDWGGMVKLTVSGKSSAWEDQIQIQNNGWFEIPVPAYLPGYEVTVVALEPLFNESSSVMVPKLTPNQIYRIPDGDLTLSINHKTVTVVAKAPVGESPVSGTYINIRASGAAGTINTVEARPGTSGYTARIDVPFGLIGFETIGAGAVNGNWQDVSTQEYDINEDFNQTIYLMIQGGSSATP